MTAQTRQSKVELYAKAVQLEIACKQWKEAAAALVEAQKLEEQAKEHLLKISNGEFEGNGVKILRLERKGSVEYKNIPELEGVDLELYRKPSSMYWLVKASVVE